MITCTRARVVEPPGAFHVPEGWPCVFLAGSIEMGHAPDWQAEVIAGLGAREAVIANPRRSAWDASWRQAIDEPRFVEQVTWELDALDRADVIAMHLDPGTKAPISLLELGLHARGGKLVVCCPEGYHRKGNVDIVCARFGVAQVSTVDELVGAVLGRLAKGDALAWPSRERREG